MVRVLLVYRPATIFFTCKRIERNLPNVLTALPIILRAYAFKKIASSLDTNY